MFFLGLSDHSWLISRISSAVMIKDNLKVNGPSVEDRWKQNIGDDLSFEL